MKVLIIIPAFNEEDCIFNLLNEIKVLHPDFSIIVINDYSEDETSKIAKKVNNVVVIDLPKNLGIGGAVQTGFIYSLRNNYDYTIQLDGDGQHDPNEIKTILEPLINNKADVVIGSGFCSKKGSFRSSFVRRTGIRIISLFTFLLIRQRILDCTSGFRAFNKKSIEFLSQNYPVDYPEPESIILLGKHNYKIIEVPVLMHPRKGGKSSISFRRGTTYYMFKVILGMIMTAIRPKNKKYAKS